MKRATTQPEVLGLATPALRDAFIPFSPREVGDYQRRTNALKNVRVKGDEDLRPGGLISREPIKDTSNNMKSQNFFL